jgi:hypothetical protein
VLQRVEEHRQRAGNGDLAGVVAPRGHQQPVAAVEAAGQPSESTTCGIRYILRITTLFPTSFSDMLVT